MIQSCNKRTIFELIIQYNKMSKIEEICPSSITVKSIPPDIYRLILKIQFDIKTKKGIGKYSQSQTIIFMLNEYSKSLNSKK